MRTFLQRAGSFLRNELTWTLLLAAAFSALTILSQNRVVGWEPGYNELQPGHHGWVSSHTMAIIVHATPENGFVGYALTHVDESGKVDYEYFDRYPVFFSTGMQALLSLKPRLSTQIYLAKQVMNAVFLLTVAAAFLVLRKLSLTPLQSLAASLLSVSSPYLLFYKDMVHYDQPALLGMLVLILAIAEFKAGRRAAVVYAATLFAVSLGRGYASLSVLLVWLLVDTIESISRTRSVRHALRSEMSLLSLRALVLGAAWAAVNLGYNIAIEAGKRGVTPWETSIVGSAVNRLALNQSFNESYASLLGWARFATDEVVRVVRWSFPVWEYEGSWQISALIVLAMAIAIFVWGRSLDRSGRHVLAILALSGGFWVVGMRNLSAFHDYTAMYFLGVPLAFFGALASVWRLPRPAWLAAAFLALATFAVRNDQIQDLHREIGNPLNVYTYDFMSMADELPAEEQSVHLAQGVPYAPFAFGFYLPGQYLAPVQSAEYFISSDPVYLPATLTPGNRRMFLFASQ